MRGPRTRVCCVPGLVVACAVAALSLSTSDSVPSGVTSIPSNGCQKFSVFPPNLLVDMCILGMPDSATERRANPFLGTKQPQLDPVLGNFVSQRARLR
jgi:hypothetical protein